MSFPADLDRGELLPLEREEVRSKDLQCVPDASFCKTVVFIYDRSKSAELLTSALEFLRHNKFDFNKWIDCAVVSDESKLAVLATE